MTGAGTVTMSRKELDRLEILGRVAERRLRAQPAWQRPLERGGGRSC